MISTEGTGSTTPRVPGTPSPAPHPMISTEESTMISMRKINDGSGVEYAQPMGVSLAKPYNGASMDELGLAYPPKPRTPRVPSHPLQGHRQGLRNNDPITLHSAFVILGINGGTAHQTACDGIPGQGCWHCQGRTFN